MNTTLPKLPDSAPFNAEQRAWINGYLAGLFSGSLNGEGQTNCLSPLTNLPSAVSRGPLLFLWGSQTGSAERLAKKFAREAGSRGFEAKALGLDAFSPANLPEARRVCIVTSTYGDGEMPDNAQEFWKGLQNGSSPRLDGLEYSVLALGDRTYVQFCEAGTLFDKRMEELGGKRIHPRTDCDVDFEVPAGAWFAGLMEALAPGAATAASGQEPEPEEETGFNKSNPYPARLKTNRVIVGEGSAKETRHFEIVLNGSGLEYEVGDALGVMPTNCAEFVDEVLRAAGLGGEEILTLSGGLECSIREALLTKLDLAPFTSKLPTSGTSAGDLVAPLRNLQSRLYSISSSPKAHPGEVHLTVGIVRYQIEGKPRKGVCSTFLADRAGDTVPVYIHKSPGFRIPADHAAPVIMVGPGTGVAPFRAFLEERRASGASGKNWLFFGDQHAKSDFLYREELEQMREEGILTRLSTAFSRDQEEKIYVQNRMIEHADELWAWLEEGASFYVCGDAKRMAKDVDAALHRIVEEKGGKDAESAAAYVSNLKQTKRYLRDVY